jgi:hypothetical protein
MWVLSESGLSYYGHADLNLHSRTQYNLSMMGNDGESTSMVMTSLRRGVLNWALCDSPSVYVWMPVYYGILLVIVGLTFPSIAGKNSTSSDWNDPSDHYSGSRSTLSLLNTTVATTPRW